MVGPAIALVALVALFVYAWVLRRRARRSAYEQALAELRAQLDEILESIGRAMTPAMRALGIALNEAALQLSEFFTRFGEALADEDEDET